MGYSPTLDLRYRAGPLPYIYIRARGNPSVGAAKLGSPKKGGGPTGRGYSLAPDPPRTALASSYHRRLCVYAGNISSMVAHPCVLARRAAMAKATLAGMRV